VDDAAKGGRGTIWTGRRRRKEEEEEEEGGA